MTSEKLEQNLFVIHNLIYFSNFGIIGRKLNENINVKIKKIHNSF